MKEAYCGVFAIALAIPAGMILLARLRDLKNSTKSTDQLILESENLKPQTRRTWLFPLLELKGKPVWMEVEEDVAEKLIAAAQGE